MCAVGGGCALGGSLGSRPVASRAMARFAIAIMTLAALAACQPSSVDDTPGAGESPIAAPIRLLGLLRGASSEFSAQYRWDRPQGDSSIFWWRRSPEFARWDAAVASNGGYLGWSTEVPPDYDFHGNTLGCEWFSRDVHFEAHCLPWLSNSVINAIRQSSSEVVTPTGSRHIAGYDAECYEFNQRPNGDERGEICLERATGVPVRVRVKDVGGGPQHTLELVSVEAKVGDVAPLTINDEQFTSLEAMGLPAALLALIRGIIRVK